MVRRNKPKITGEDPKYAHTFERFRPIESDMPPDVKIPGVEDQPPKQDATPAPSSKKAVKPKAAKRPVTTLQSKPAKAKPTPTAKPIVESKPLDDRQITLDAAVKVEQAEAMKPLLEKGLQQRDIVMLAGRRTTDQFVISPTYVPKPEAERLPMQQGYHTSKRLDGKILDAMRHEHDPLRVRSDPAMVRGQFETLFWTVLDDVIAELREKYT